MAVLFVLGSCCSHSHRDANLLLITLDTTRADHLGCYSPGKARTPSLDALAARGVLFRDATAQAPVTLPSHASILTGAYPPFHGLRDMEGFVLSPTHPTIATIARGKGYATAAFVGSRVLAREFGLGNGFSTYDDEIEGGAEGPAERRAAAVTDRALGWLEQNHQSKFLLWAHYFDPHAPYENSYAEEVAYMDEHVGRLLDGLKQKGLESRTLVVVIGDHGESLGEHGEQTHGVFLYDSTLRVPFLMAGPGLPSGGVVEKQVRTIDVMPTALALLGLEAGTGAQGANLLPLITKGSDVGSGFSYSETLYPRTFFGWSELRAMRTGTEKLILTPKPQFHDLKADPGETSSRPAAEGERLRAELWRVAGEQTRRRLTVNPIAAKTRRELESLGYIGGGASSQIQLGTPAADPNDRIEVLKLLSSAEEAMATNDWLRTAQLMEQALRLDGTNPRVFLYLATAFERQRQYQRAISVLRRALDAKIETARIHARLGVDHLRIGQVDKAFVAMEQASRLDPQDLNNLHNLGMAYLQSGRVDDAARSFQAILVRDERNSAAHNGLGLVAVQRRDAESARRSFEKAIEVNPLEVKSLLDLGILYQQLGKREDSIRHLESFLSKARPGQFDEQIPAVRAAIQEMRGAR